MYSVWDWAGKPLLEMVAASAAAAMVVYTQPAERRLQDLKPNMQATGRNMSESGKLT